MKTPTAMLIKALDESKTDDIPDERPAVIDQEAMPQMPHSKYYAIANEVAPIHVWSANKEDRW